MALVAQSEHTQESISAGLGLERRVGIWQCGGKHVVKASFDLEAVTSLGTGTPPGLVPDTPWADLASCEARTSIRGERAQGDGKLVCGG